MSAAATERGTRVPPAAGTRPTRMLVLGGSSEIAVAIVAEFARRASCSAALVGRDPARLARARETLEQAGAEIAGTTTLDARDLDAHEDALESAIAQLGGIDVAIVAPGVLGAPGALPDDIDAAVHAMQLNFLGAGSLLLRVARRMRAAGEGTIVVLSSVAAERPRRANAVYGAAKAGLDALARGLGDELAGSGVRVLVVRPGFVHTRMTEGLSPAPFATTPDAVARTVADGVAAGAHTVWVPGRLRWPMLALRMLPRRLWRRLPL